MVPTGAGPFKGPVVKGPFVKKTMPAGISEYCSFIIRGGVNRGSYIQDPLYILHH